MGRPAKALSAVSTSSGVSGRSGRGSIWTNPGFRFLLGSTATSALGSSTTAISLSWLIYHYTGSALDIAYLGLTGVIPGVALGLFAGVLADRYDRRRLMVGSDAVRALAMAVLAATLYFVGFSLLVILAVMTLVYSFSALFFPASSALLPRVVARDQLEDANGVLSASTQLGSAIGAGVGGLVIALVGALVGLGVNTATYAVSGVLLFSIAPEIGRVRREGAAPARSVRRELLEGLGYMRAHLPILEITLGFVPASVFYPLITNFFVVYARTVLGPDPALFGYLVATFTAGGAAGSLLVGRLRARRFAGIAFGVGLVGMGAAGAVMVVGRFLTSALVGAGGLGLSIGVIGTVYYSTMQAIVPNEVLARVLSIDMVGSLVAVPAGLLLGGVLSSTHGILFSYSVAALGLIANGILVLALPGVRSIRYLDPVDLPPTRSDR